MLNNPFRKWLVNFNNSLANPCSLYYYYNHSIQCIFSSDKDSSKLKIGFFPGVQDSDYFFTDQDIHFLLDMDHIITTDYVSQMLLSTYSLTSVIPPPIIIDNHTFHTESIIKDSILLYIDNYSIPDNLSYLWKNISIHLRNYPDSILYIRCPEKYIESIYLFSRYGIDKNRYVILDDDVNEPYKYITDSYKAIIYPYSTIPIDMGYLFWISQFIGLAWISEKCAFYDEMLQWGSLYDTDFSLQQSIRSIFDSTYDKKQSSIIKSKSISTYLTHSSNIEFAFRQIICSENSTPLSIAVVCSSSHYTIDVELLKIFRLSQRTYCLFHNYTYYETEHLLDNNHSHDFILHISPYLFIINNDFRLDKFIRSRLKFTPQLNKISIGSSYIQRYPINVSIKNNVDIQHYRFFQSKIWHPSIIDSEWTQPGDFSCDFTHLIENNDDIALKPILDAFLQKIHSSRFKKLSQRCSRFIGKAVQLNNKPYTLLPYSSVNMSKDMYWSLQYGSKLILYQDQAYPEEDELSITDKIYFSTSQLFDDESRINNSSILAVEISQEMIYSSLPFLRHIYVFTKKHLIPFYFIRKEDKPIIPPNIYNKLFFVQHDSFFIPKQDYVEPVLKPFLTNVSHPFDPTYILLRDIFQNDLSLSRITYLYHYIYTF